jgi:hypothetical protein
MGASRGRKSRQRQILNRTTLSKPKPVRTVISNIPGSFALSDSQERNLLGEHHSGEKRWTSSRKHASHDSHRCSDVAEHGISRHPSGVSSVTSD